MSIPQFYLDDSRFGLQMSAYRQYMERVIMLIGRDSHSNQTREEILNDVEDIIAFEKSFAKITVESVNVGNFTTAFRSSKLSDMSAYLPSVSF